MSVDDISESGTELQSDVLRVCAVESDPKQVVEARRKLVKAGLYRVRVTVLQADPETIRLPKYFANLVVSSRSLTQQVDESWDEQRFFAELRARGCEKWTC
ncbi:MAG: class I SAM-dependent methyltransferase [Planctomycetales bacterium]